MRERQSNAFESDSVVEKVSSRKLNMKQAKLFTVTRKICRESFNWEIMNLNCVEIERSSAGVVVTTEEKNEVEKHVVSK